MMKKRWMILMIVMCCTSWFGFVQADEKNDQSDHSSASVGYLGPEGTYTQEACEKYFDQNDSLYPYRTVNDAVDALVNHQTDYAVIPQENTIGGAVVDYLDILIAKPELSVVGEVELPINQNLLVLEDTELNDIHTVYSHKQGIAQGKEWLEEHLPDAEVIEVSSTAEGAKMVSENGDHSCVAIAAAGCAEVYHLEILAANIQNNDQNKTRFYVLSLEEPSTQKEDRLAFIASGPAEELPILLAGMVEQDMTLVTLHDRPQKTELGEYDYVIECSDSSYDSYLELTEESALQLRYLGSFDVR